MVARCTCEQAVIAKLAELIRWANVRGVGGQISHRELVAKLMISHRELVDKLARDREARQAQAKPKRSK